MQKRIIKLDNAPSIISTASVVGSKEYEGPLGKQFDFHDNDNTFGQKTWEKSEAEMQKTALNLAMSKAKLTDDDIDALFAGDLINQCTSSTYGLLSFNIPFFGLFGACSTAAESLILASLLINSGTYKRTAAVTSSHNCSAERQFRTPLEYGGQRTPTSQWTVTGAGAFILSNDACGPFVSEVMPGCTINKGINDANNMGAAMAPAAVDTLIKFFEQTKTTPDNYGKIVTGDLGNEGYGIVVDLMEKEGYSIRDNYTDCGLFIYDHEKQDMHAGGSGCGCSAVVLASHFLNEIKSGRMSDILFIGTGALMSPASLQQGESIPAIAHLVHITKERI